MRIIPVLAVCALLAACSHTPPPAPAPLPAAPIATPTPPPRPAPKPVAPHTAPAPTPVVRPQMPDDHTPEHVCSNLAKRRAEDAATLGEDAKSQQAVRDKVYAVCIGTEKNPAP